LKSAHPVVVALLVFTVQLDGDLQELLLDPVFAEGGGEL
jgi:hypothetical protein